MMDDLLSADSVEFLATIQELTDNLKRGGWSRADVIVSEWTSKMVDRGWAMTILNPVIAKAMQDAGVAA
jgi:hypothetical protein